MLNHTIKTTDGTNITIINSSVKKLAKALKSLRLQRKVVDVLRVHTLPNKRKSYAEVEKTNH